MEKRQECDLKDQLDKQQIYEKKMKGRSKGILSNFIDRNQAQRNDTINEEEHKQVQK